MLVLKKKESPTQDKQYSNLDHIFIRFNANYLNCHGLFSYCIMCIIQICFCITYAYFSHKLIFWHDAAYCFHAKIQLINVHKDPNRSEHFFETQAQKAVQRRTLLASSGRPFHSWNTLLFVLLRCVRFVKKPLTYIYI